MERGEIRSPAFMPVGTAATVKAMRPEEVRASGADVYLTSDLRHHRAGEFLEHDGPALVDVAHWAAEWTWLPVVERKLLDAVRQRGDTVETRVSALVTDPWTFRVDR